MGKGLKNSVPVKLEKGQQSICFLRRQVLAGESVSAPGSDGAQAHVAASASDVATTAVAAAVMTAHVPSSALPSAASRGKGGPSAVPSTAPAPSTAPSPAPAGVPVPSTTPQPAVASSSQRPSVSLGGDIGFSSAKSRQNAFQTAIRSTGCPQSVKAEWQRLSKLGRFNQERQDFVTDVATVIGGNYSEIVVKIEASLGTETKSGNKGGYVSYERFTGIHGKTKADELIRLKAVEEIEDDELPAGHTLKYPDTHLFRYRERVFSDMTVATKKQKIEAQGEASPEFAAAFLSAVGQTQLADSSAASTASPAPAADTAGQSGAKLEPQAVTGGQPTKKEKEDSKAAVAEAVKAYRYFEQERRKIRGVQRQSAACENTRGSVVEKALDGLMVKSNELAETLQDHETDHISGVVFNKADIEMIKVRCVEMASLTKASKSKADGLKNLFSC